MEQRIQEVSICIIIEIKKAKINIFLYKGILRPKWRWFTMEKVYFHILNSRKNACRLILNSRKLGI